MRRTDYDEPNLLNRLYTGDREAYKERVRRKIAAYEVGYKQRGGTALDPISEKQVPLLTPRQYALQLYAVEMLENSTQIEDAVYDTLERMDESPYCATQITMGDRYIVDFVLRDGVILECDSFKYHPEPNRVRDQFLNGLGYRVLHLNQNTCMDRQATINAIELFYCDEDCSVRYT